MGDEAKDWEREEAEGGTEDFVNFGGGFEVEALAFIAQGVGLNKSRLADHMGESQSASWNFRAFAFLAHLTTIHSVFYSQILCCRCVRRRT